MTAGIVGLGLIGGSLAKAYRAHGARVLAFDTDSAVLSFAQLDGTVDAVLTKENVSECDIVLIAVRPGAGGVRDRVRSRARARLHVSRRSSDGGQPPRGI